MRKTIDDIPVGTWENVNYKCPPACKKTATQVLVELNHESSEFQAYQYEKKQRSKERKMLREKGYPDIKLNQNGAVRE